MNGEQELLRTKQEEYERQLKLFDEHVRHFEALDPILEEFAREHSFALEKNQLHSPCRLLRKKGNPEYIIGIEQEGIWFRLAYRDDLPHTVGVTAYLVDEKKEFVYQMSEEIAYFQHFSTIQENLNDYLKRALACIERWNAEVIRREGAQSKHPMAYWREQGGIKIQTAD
jgi:hypothetical protein